MDSRTVNRFRRARGRILRRQIDTLRSRKGRDLHILDVGGRPGYWENIGVDGIARIVLLNVSAAEVERKRKFDLFENRIGDARDLRNFDDGSFDLVHSNSVIEHVGLWDDMCRMAAECMRVGAAGWVQTPAWEFPVEPHYRLPAVHWLAQPARRAALRLSKTYGKLAIRDRRRHVDRINLLSGDEVRALFPGARIWVERFLLLPKSYVARW
ncbi:MAG: class I SAM-dependent methyltransferase [Alphaproteobacteria bacterium]